MAPRNVPAYWMCGLSDAISWIEALAMLSCTGHCLSWSEYAYHDEASDSDRNHDHVEDTSLAGTISKVTNDDRASRGNSIRRNRQKLCVGAGVAHASQDSGQEQRESVQGHQASHVDDGVAPALPVFESSSDVAAVVLLSGVGLVVGGETTANTDAVLRGEEASGAGPVEDHPPAESADEHGGDTLQHLLADVWKMSQRVCLTSMMKIQAQPSLPPIPSINAIAAASNPPNEPANAAAEKKIAARNPSSERLYQQDR